MENMMRRAISAFMALVLVLGMMPGIPMFAGAEEVETQPETVAVETAEAVTVPEETEAPETTAAPETEAPETTAQETVPETTAAQETVPEETAAEETVPAETEEQIPQETEPQETVPEETIPEETVPEVSEDPADANDPIVLAKKIEISASKDRTYVGDDVKLTATFTPSDTTETDVEWVVSGGSYNETALTKGYLRAMEAGVFTITAKTIDGTDLESESIEVEFVDYWMEINENPNAIPEENQFEGLYVLQTGKTMPISVRYMTQAFDQSEPVTERLSEPNLEWTLLGDGDKYAELVVNASDPKEVTLKAKLVTEYKYITVQVTDKTIGCVDTIEVRLYPNSYKLYITNEDGEDVTNGTILLDTANPETAMTQTLTATIWPAECGDEDLVWSCSDTLVDLEDLDGDETANRSMEFTASALSGETVITICGAENNALKATVTIKRERLVQVIEPSKATAELTELLEGKSATLVAVEANAEREIVGNELLKWELDEEDEEYATLSDKGVLKAKDIEMGKVVHVRCSVLGNEENAYFDLYVAIRPKATAVKLLACSLADSGEARMSYDEVINDKTITVDTLEYTSRCLDYFVEPFSEDPDAVGAKQEVTWKSSNTAVAAFDPLTDELVWKGKNGTTTITATAADGSGKKASVKLTFGTKLRELSFVDEEGMFLRSGKNWTFGLNYYPENATNTSVTWAVYARDEYGDFTADASSIATISTSGKLTAKTVYDNHMVRVVATSKEDARIQAVYDVLIRPKTDDFLTLLDGDGNCVTKSTIQVDLGDTVVLTAAFVGEEEGGYDDSIVPVWTSSNKKIAEVEDGIVFTGEKTGSATITAKIDGKTATVTIKVVSQVDDIYVYDKKNPDNSESVLASGKSLDLKADVCDWDTATDKLPNGKPTVSKVRWEITEGAEYATVSSSGKVTAKKDLDIRYLPAEVTVTAYATDGSPAYGSYTITIYPAAERVRIRIDGKAYDTYTYFMSEEIDEYFEGESALTLTAEISPWDESWEDAQVTWKSSNKKIADVDEYGNVTAFKPGTVTITATAADGTNKKAAMKLVITSTALTLDWNNNANELVADQFFAIAGGRSLTLKPVFYGVDGKKLTVPVEWSISKVDEGYGTAFVKKFNKGAITTEKVTEAKFTEVTIKFDARYAGFDGAEVDAEGKYAYVTVAVGVYPATTSLSITHLGSVTNKVWKQAGCADFELGVLVNEGAAYGWTWKSSNEKIATVDEYGVVSCTWDEKTGSYKAGTVTITATAKDGSGKKDTITIVFEK